MKKLLIIGATALTLTGCATARQDRALTGAALGGAAGAVIGGAATSSWGGAAAGGAIGAVTGAIIADATHPGRCYVRNRYGKLRRVHC